MRRRQGGRGRGCWGGRSSGDGRRGRSSPPGALLGEAGFLGAGFFELTAPGAVFEGEEVDLAEVEADALPGFVRPQDQAAEGVGAVGAVGRGDGDDERTLAVGAELAAEFVGGNALNGFTEFGHDGDILPFDFSAIALRGAVFKGLRRMLRKGFWA